MKNLGKVAIAAIIIIVVILFTTYLVYNDTKNREEKAMEETPSVTSAPSPTAMQEDQMGDTQLLNRLMTSAVVTDPVTKKSITLIGPTTTEGTTTITFGKIAIPFPYTAQLTGQNGVTTLDFEDGGVTKTYLVMFTPGEASWQALDMVDLGENVNVSDVKVVGEKVTVVVDGTPTTYDFVGGKFSKTSQ